MMNSTVNCKNAIGVARLEMHYRPTMGAYPSLRNRRKHRTADTLRNGRLRQGSGFVSDSVNPYLFFDEVLLRDAFEFGWQTEVAPDNV